LIEQGGESQTPAAPAEEVIQAFCRQFSLEHAFLMVLLGRKDAGRQQWLQTWAPRVDWNRLQRITSAELFAYLGRVLAETGLLARCPPSLQEQLRNGQRFTAAQWLRWRLELRHIVHVFRDHGIDLILLKGAVLSTAAYPDSCLRSMTDIDLLVRPADAEWALRLIEAAGFRCPGRFLYVPPHDAKRSSGPAGAEVAVPLQKTGTRACVEVHTQLESAEPWYPVPTDELWKRAEVFRWGDLQCKTLERHEFLLHLIMHLSEHHLFEHGLRALLDVHLWIELHGETLDWTWICAEAVRRGYAQWVHLSLRIVHDAFATPVPANVFADLGTPPQLERMQQLAYEQILAEGREVRNVPKLLIGALAQRSVFSAARLLLKRLVPSRAAAANVRTVWRPKLTGFRLAVRSLVNDLRIRVPQCYRAWRAGDLRWSRLKRAAMLERSAGQLRELMDARGR
jgi:hypothetical protein